MMSKKFRSKALNAVSVLALSITLLSSSFISPTAAMDEEVNINAKKRKRGDSGESHKKRKTRAQENLGSTPHTKKSNSRTPSSTANRQDSLPILAEVKEEPFATKPPHMEDYIRENIYRINPRNGKRNCVKCAISFYNWVRSQSDSPKAVDVVGPKEPNMISHPKNPNYLIFKDDKLVSWLPSGILQVTLEDTSEDEPKQDEDYSIMYSSSYVNGDKSILFKYHSVEAFQTLLSNLLVERMSQAGLVFFADKNSAEGGHHWGFYSYKDSKGKQVDLIVDPQPKAAKIYPASQLQKLMDDHDYRSAWIWYDAPGFHPEVLERFIKVEADVVDDVNTPDPFSSPLSTSTTPTVATPDSFGSPSPLPGVTMAEILPEEPMDVSPDSPISFSTPSINGAEETEFYDEESEGPKESSSRRSKIAPSRKKKRAYESEESSEEAEELSFSNGSSDHESDESEESIEREKTQKKSAPKVSKKRKRKEEQESNEDEKPAKARKTETKTSAKKKPSTPAKSSILDGMSQDSSESSEESEDGSFYDGSDAKKEKSTSQKKASTRTTAIKSKNTRAKPAAKVSKKGKKQEKEDGSESSDEESSFSSASENEEEETSDDSQNSEADSSKKRKTAKDLTPNDVEKMIKLAKEGGVYNKIAKDMNYERGVVGATLRANGIFKPKRELTKSEIDKILEFSKEKLTIEQIAKKAKRSQSLVNAILIVNGITRKPGLITISKSDLETIKKEGKKKRSASKIAKKIGSSTSVVGSYLQALGIDTKKITKDDIKKIKRLHERGYTQDNIAKEIGCGHSIIGYHLKKLGVKTRKTPKKLNEADIKQMVKWKKEGRSTSYITKKMNCDKKLVLRTLKKEDPTLLRPKTEITPALIKQMVDMKTANPQTTAQAISEELGCSPSVVASNLRKAGFSTTPRTKITPALVNQMVEMKKANPAITNKQIAEKIGCNALTVGIHLRQASQQ